MTSRGTNGFGERRSPPWRCHVDSALGFVYYFHERIKGNCLQGNFSAMGFFAVGSSAARLFE